MTVNLMGIDICDYSFEEGGNRGLELICSDKVSQVITINPEMYKETETNKNFLNI